MKTKKIKPKTFEWLDTTIDGILNDFEDGVSTKEETKNALYTTIFDNLVKEIQELRDNKSIPLVAGVKTDACGKWQKERPAKPCLFIHRYNDKDEKPGLQLAVLDCDILCVTDVEYNEFISTMDDFADGEFYIVEYH